MATHLPSDRRLFVSADNPQGAIDCILQLTLNWNRLSGRFEFDKPNQRSRAWRIGKPPRFNHGTQKWDNWGAFPGLTDPGDGTVPWVSHDDPLQMDGLREYDTVFVLIVPLNLPENSACSLFGVVSRSNEGDDLNYATTPFLDARAVFRSTGVTMVDGTRSFWLGRHGLPDPAADMKIGAGHEESEFYFMIGARIFSSDAARDFSFDPEMDVGGGDRNFALARIGRFPEAVLQAKADRQRAKVSGGPSQTAVD